MKLSVSRYTAMLSMQFGLMIADIIFNCVSFFPKTHTAILILFIFQDLFLILALTAMLVNFFSTYLFQAGLMELLFDKFRSLMIVSIGYLALSVTLHIYWLVEKWDDPKQPLSLILSLIFVGQRCLSPWYYYFYKRAALRISDPRFYEDIDWLNRDFSQHK